MKKISELGLELIQLEGDLLLVDKNSKIIGGDWYYNSYYNTVDRRDGYVSVGKSVAGITVSKVISSTKPLEGIPLLVIEDEVDKLAIEDVINISPNTYMKDVYEGFFKRGYEKAKSTYKFTEEDMVEFAMNMISQYQFGNTNIHNRGILMESLPKKELWIEVEFKETKTSVFIENDNAPYGIYEPKIVNNQIKGIYR